jgi:hypothetical protein
VVIGVGIEPHLRWKTYCRSILEMAQELEVGLLVTLGALLAEVPHTRPVRLTGFATDPELAARLGVNRRYKGITACSPPSARAAANHRQPLAQRPHYLRVEPPRGPRARQGGADPRRRSTSAAGRAGTLFRRHAPSPRAERKVANAGGARGPGGADELPQTVRRLPRARRIMRSSAAPAAAASDQ